MTNKKIQLDHIVLLLPYRDILDPPSWITDHFSVSPGGTHADGKTANKLILFKDGTYLELVAFIDDDPNRRKGHFWDKEFGIVDFALTTPGRLDYDGLQTRLSSSGSEIRYGAPLGGGRKRPDGVDLKWEITAPLNAGRGYVPFFCNDLTDRDLRVDPDGKLDHPSGATGISAVVLKLQKGNLQDIAIATAAITGGQTSKDGAFQVGVPRETESTHNPTIHPTSATDSQEDLQISLIIQTKITPPRGIERGVGNGHVSIGFSQ